MRSDCHLGFAITGSFCTFEKIKKQIELLRDEAASITPIFSQHAYELDTRFAETKSFVKEIETITGRSAIHTIQGAEPVGPKKLFDALVIRTLHGKHSSKACKWNHGYSGFDGGEVAPSERASHDHCYFHERCAWHQSAEHRKAHGDEAYLFRSVWTGRCGKKAEFLCGGYDKDCRDSRICTGKGADPAGIIIKMVDLEPFVPEKCISSQKGCHNK